VEEVAPGIVENDEGWGDLQLGACSRQQVYLPVVSLEEKLLQRHKWQGQWQLMMLFILFLRMIIVIL
jgi:hypothetical protein